jgi:DNA-directed RNA polymerase specialized sigma24 family protein
MARPGEVLVEDLRRRGDRGGGGAGGPNGERFYRLAMRVTGTQWDAEEVTQDALWAAVQD